MAKERSLARDRAFEIYKMENGEISNRKLAGLLGVPEKTISGWKCKDKWDKQLNGVSTEVLQKKKRSTPKQSTPKKLTPKQEKKEFKKLELEEAELTEKQKLFCLYYIKNFNATMAAIKAGYSKESAHVEGARLLKNAKVAAEIRRLKGQMQQEVFFSAMDVLNKYAAIAFADIGDYLTFGRKEEQVMGMFGPVYEGKGKNKKPVTQTVNYVDFNESSAVDTSIISEVKQGKNGIGIKLADKIRALEKLEQYFDLLPDHHKRRVEEERLKIEREKVALLKLKTGEEEPENVDDGWLDALEGKAQEVWADEEI